MDSFVERPDADERTTLTQSLDLHRRILRWKCEDLGHDGLAATTTASTMHLAGVLKHVTVVEEGWFSHVFAGEEYREPWAGVDWEADPDWEWHSALDDDPGDLLEAHASACDRSRAIVAAAESSTSSPRARAHAGRRVCGGSSCT